MADTTLDDVYDDPDNILADTDDSVDGAQELPADLQQDASQSIFVPEKSGPFDDRPGIEELDNADGGEDHDEMNGAYPEDSDPDSTHLGDMDTKDEADGTEQ